MVVRSFARFAIASALLIAAPASAQEASENEDPLALEDLFTVKGVSGVQVSPAGDAILYTVQNSDLEENENNTDIWLIRRAASGWDEPIQLTRHERNDVSPRWHPDGVRFAFLSSQRGGSGPDEGAGGQKLYLMDSRGGEPLELYGHATSVGQYAWSPDGSHIAFVAVDEESEDEEERKELGRDSSVEDDEGRFSHLWVLDVDAKEATRVTEGEAYTVGPFDWSPDGERLAFSATPTGRPFDSWKSDVYVVSAHDSAASPRRLTTNPGPDANPRWMPDGRHLVYSGQQTDSYEIAHNQVFRIVASGGEPEDISPNTDVQPGTYTFTADGSGAFFETVTGTTVGLFYMDLDDRNPVRITPDEGVYGGSSFSDDRSTVAFTYQSPKQASEVYAVDMARPTAGAAAATTALTSHNEEAAELVHGATEVMQWNGADGREIEGVVIYPADWSPEDGPRATVVKIHGGPSGVYLENFQASGFSDAQRYAADGYVVLMPNPRGSSGYGEEGLQAVVGDWGGLDFQDIMTGVDALIDKGISHPDSLGVMGWSYGGYMTSWTVTQTSRFKAAIAGAAITENIAMWGTQDIQHVFEAYFGGGPYEPGMWEIYQKSNPMAFVEQATTPTMIIHGENDPRVPPNQARIFYRGLKANGVDTKLVWLPRTGHGPSEPGLLFETLRNQKEWIDQNVRRRARPVTE